MPDETCISNKTMGPNLAVGSRRSGADFLEPLFQVCDLLQGLQTSMNLSIDPAVEESELSAILTAW